MLNTDLHNHGVKKKMSLEDFIRNNRGIDNGSDLDPDYLKALYNDILVEALKLDKNEGDLGNLFVDPRMRGWVLLWEKKKLDSPSSKRKPKTLSSIRTSSEYTRKRYWAVLTSGCLYLFSDHDTINPYLIISLEGTTTVAASSAPFSEEKGEKKVRDFLLLPKLSKRTSLFQCAISGNSDLLEEMDRLCFTIDSVEKEKSIKIVRLNAAASRRSFSTSKKTNRSTGGVTDVSTSEPMCFMVEQSDVIGRWIRSIQDEANKAMAS